MSIDADFSSIRDKLERWITKSNPNIAVFYLPKATKKNPYPQVQAVVSPRLKTFIYDEEVRRKFVDSCYESMGISLPIAMNPRQDALKDTMPIIDNDVVQAGMHWKRSKLSELVKMYMQKSKEMSAGYWGREAFKPEFWPEHVEFRPPTTNASVPGKILQKGEMDLVLQSYIAWRQTDTPSEIQTDGQFDPPPDGQTDTPPDGQIDPPPDGQTDTPSGGHTDTPPDRQTDPPPDRQTDTPPDIQTDRQTDTSPDIQTDGQTDTSPDIQTDGQTDTSPDIQTDGQTYTSPDIQTDGQTDTSPDIQTDGQTDTSPDIQTDGQTDTSPDIQTDSHASKHFDTPSSTTELQKYLYKLVEGRERPTERLLSACEGMKLTARTFLSMRDKFADEIIDAFMMTFLKKEESTYEYVPCSIMHMLFSRRQQHLLQDFEIVSPNAIGIFNRGRRHWVLIVMNFSTKTLTILDPLGELQDHLEILLSSWLAYVKDETWTIGTLNHTKQSDSISCGLFCLMFAEKFIRHEALQYHVDPIVITAFKRHIIDTVTSNTDETLLMRVCRICCMENSRKKNTNAEWVGCDECGMYWVHYPCLHSKASFSEIVGNRWLCDFCKM